MRKSRQERIVVPCSALVFFNDRMAQTNCRAVFFTAKSHFTTSAQNCQPHRSGGTLVRCKLRCEGGGICTATGLSAACKLVNDMSLFTFVLLIR